MSVYSLKVVGCFALIGWICTTTSFSQNRNCFSEVVNGQFTGRIICPVTEVDPYPLGPLRIPNGTKVVIRIAQKSPFDDCTLAEIKLTEIKEADPIVTILQLFTKTTTGTALATQAPLSATIANNSLAKLLQDESATLSTDLQNRLDQTKTLIDGSHKPLVERVNRVISVPPRSVAAFGLEATPLIVDLEAEKTASEDPASTTNSLFLEQNLIRSQASYDSLREQVKTISNDPDVIGVLQNLNVVAAQLAAYRANHDSIVASRSLFKTVLKTLKNVQASIAAAMAAASDPETVFSQDLYLLPYSQQVATTTLSCSNAFTKKVTTAQIPVTFHYKSDPRLTVSVGPLLSTIPKQKLGITPIKTGVDGSGVPTFRNEFAVADRSSHQIVPFAFLNYRILNFGTPKDPTKQPTYSFHFSAGIGLNPNSGSNEVEYFIGPAFGIKRLLIQFGDHIGRYQKGFTGGFNIGDPVPANFPSSLPIERKYRHGFGIALSYKIPL